MCTSQCTVQATPPARALTPLESLPTTTTTVSTEYTCTYSGETVGVLFRLVSDTGSPISGVQIKGQSVVYCNTERQVQALPLATTNSSGWADMRDGNGGNYYLTFGYAGTSYNVMISVEPVALTLATLKLPSGILTTQDCAFGNLQSCSPPSTSTQKTGSVATTTLTTFATSGGTLSSSYASTLSAINSSSACSLTRNWSDSPAMNTLLSNVMSQPKFLELAQNRSFMYAGYGCSFVNGTLFTIVFQYSDEAHSFKVCGNSTVYPYYQISAMIYLLPTGYDLSRTAYSTRYYDSQNLTISCTTNIRTT